MSKPPNYSVGIYEHPKAMLTLDYACNINTSLCPCTNAGKLGKGESWGQWFSEGYVYPHKSPCYMWLVKRQNKGQLPLSLYYFSTAWHVSTKTGTESFHQTRKRLATVYLCLLTYRISFCTFSLLPQLCNKILFPLKPFHFNRCKVSVVRYISENEV